MKIKFWSNNIYNPMSCVSPLSGCHQRIYHYGSKIYSHIVEHPDGQIIYYPVGLDAKRLTSVDMKLLYFNDKNS